MYVTASVKENALCSSCRLSESCRLWNTCWGKAVFSKCNKSSGRPPLTSLVTGTSILIKMGCEVLTAKAITDTIIWDATQRSLVKSYRSIRKEWCIFLLLWIWWLHIIFKCLYFCSGLNSLASQKIILRWTVFFYGHWASTVYIIREPAGSDKCWEWNATIVLH